MSRASPFQTRLISNGSLYNFSSILVSRWKNRRKWLASPNLEIWGLKPSRSISRHQMELLGVKTLQS
jgi:hypothetical protein